MKPRLPSWLHLRAKWSHWELGAVQRTMARLRHVLIWFLAVALCSATWRYIVAPAVILYAEVFEPRNDMSTNR